MDLFGIPSAISAVIFIGLLAVKIFALISAVSFEAAAYDAAGKWSKKGWVIVTGIAAALQAISGGGFGLINLGLTVAALVYLADVRPALSSLRRR